MAQCQYHFRGEQQYSLMGVGENMKIIKSVMLACGLAIVASGALLWGGSVMSQEEKKSQTGDVEVNLVSSGRITNITVGIDAAIKRINIKNNLAETPIEKLDFSLPGDVAYGENPTFELFNPEGGQLDPILDLRSLKGWEDYSDSPKYIFTFGNRTKENGTDKSELMVILPNVKEAPCLLINKNREQSFIPELSVNINLVPHPQEVPENEIVTLPNEEGCIKTPSGFYYYAVLRKR